MSKKQIIIDGVDVSGWTDEEIRYNFEKHSPKAIRQIAFDLYKQLKRKEQECEQEKALKETYLACYKAKHGDIKGKLFKLKQTLVEIKEIAEPFCNACQEHEPEKSGRDCMYCNYGKILQKISEVENEI